MAFLLQLRLLLWKNLTLRRRHWGRLVVEIVWPLFLFIILFLVRLRGLKKFHHECSFEEKAMPSAGILPFVQSFVCTFNNTCHQSLWTEPGRLQSYNQSFVNRLVEELEEILQRNLDSEEKVSALARVGTDLSLLPALLARAANGSLVLPEGGLSPSSLLRDPTAFSVEMAAFLGRLWWEDKVPPVTPGLVKELASLRLNTESLKPGLVLQLATEGPAAVLCSQGGNTTQALLAGTSDPVVARAAIGVLCNLTGPDWLEVAGLFSSQLDPDAALLQLSKFVAANTGAPLGLQDWRAFAPVGSAMAADFSQTGSFGKISRDVVEILEEVGRELETAGRRQESNSTEEEGGAGGAFAAFGLVSRLVCGRNLSSSPFTSGGQANRFDNLRDQIQEKEDDKSKYKYDNTTSEECNALIQEMERSLAIRFLWSQVKPLFRGRILYTPDTPATRRLVSAVDASYFRPLERLQAGLGAWRDGWADTVAGILFSREAQALLPSILESPEGPPLPPGLLSPGTLTALQRQLAAILPANNSDAWRSGWDGLQEVIGNVSAYLDCVEMDKFEAVETEEDLSERGLELLETNQLWAGLVFEGLVPGQKELPKFVTYKIRIDADKVDSTKRYEDRLPRRGPRRRPGIDLKYLYYGFAYLQDMVEHAIIAEHSGRNISSLPGVTLQQMPYPCYIQDRFILAIARTFPLFMTLAWVYSASMIIKSIVHEKEMRLKETMRVMGLGNAVHWLSWFLDSFLVMFSSCVLLTIILVYGNILENSDPSLVFCFMLCYTVSTIMLAFFLSTLFSRANIAAAAGGIIFFCLYLPYSFMVVWQESLNQNAKIASCLISNIAFGFGCSYFSHYEERGVGAQWDNIWVSPLAGDAFSMAGCMGMLLFDSLLYGLLMWYVEAVWPGQYGVPKPPFFFLTRTYWLGRQAPPGCQADIQLGETQDNNETEPTHLPLGVSIKHLHKVYSNGKVAVEDLNLNFYSGQITSFLGHNGAGKTTTISILTGLFPPSAGTALINGLDIQRDMDSIRRSLGTCPQHNVLFHELTVEEHLWFYARLKGEEPEAVREQAERMVQDLGIPHKKTEQSQNLSGGMQRKLSIACAFIGGSKVVVLDEPTAGVDPYSRRAIWDLLLKYKAGRTIILTTHFMDEADLLGDRIAIINCGRLVCCGSSLFLKSLYGTGYYLTLIKSPERVEEREVSSVASSVETTASVDEGISDLSTHETILNPSTGNERFPIYPITQFIQKHIPNAQLVEEIGSDIIFILPTKGDEEAPMKRFEILFTELDKNLDKLNVTTYGLSDTTLEEIFLKVASNEHDGAIVRGQQGLGRALGRAGLKQGALFKMGNPRKGGQIEDELTDESDSEVPVGDTDEKVLTTSSNPSQPARSIVNGKRLVMKHIVALEIKRFHHSKRNRKGVVCEIIMPALFVCLAMCMTLILPGLVEEPPLEISPWIYPTKGGENTLFFANDDPRSAWPGRYEAALRSRDGFGTKCIQQGVKHKPGCDSGLLRNSEDLLEIPDYPANVTINDRLNRECSCVVGTQVCPAGSFSPPPPGVPTPSGDRLLDMTGRNVSQWLLKTRDDFYKRRYGGFEFGVGNPASQLDMRQVERVFTRLDQASNLGDDRINEFAKSAAFGLAETRIREDSTFDFIRVWFNNKGWAASVAYMNAVNNVVLRAMMTEAKQQDFDMSFEEADEYYDTSKYGIKLINHPMNYTELQLDKELIRQMGISLTHAICVIFALSFVPASFVVFHIEERVSKVKHLHFVSGVAPATYWLAALLWDLTLYLVTATLCVFIFLVFDAQAYISEKNFGSLVLLLFLYGWSSVPLMYPASFVFSVPSSAFVTLSCANLFIGIITTITTFVLENFDDEELTYIASILRKVFLIFPHYCLGRGLMDMATEHTLNNAISVLGLESVRNRFDFDFLGKYFFYMFIQGIVFFSFTLLLQSQFWTYWFSKAGGPKKDYQAVEEDEDVKRERERILNGDVGEDVMQVKNLFKRYKKNAKQAVDQLTFGVRRAECFGLLGVNGAGKTTTFKMLTGDTEVTAGEATVNGFSILSQLDAVRQNLGYCPQFDALDPLLTGREHLRLYARLRGLDEDSVKREAESGLSRLGLAAYADRCAGTYSGGNKRKLSTAIALIGDPSIVFLDEPTSGMDPGARRFLWNSILAMVRAGQSVVLTSHSMEECEALCTRIGIMVNGGFKCIGSIQHLKNRFGSGYSLTVRCREERTAEVVELLGQLLPLARLQEEHHTQLKFQLPTAATRLPVVFRHLERCREQGILQDYSITQTTLDEVFIRFASEQTELLEDEISPNTLKTRLLARLGRPASRASQA